MLHNEHLRKADETYEIRHDHNGNAIHVLIKDGEAIIFPTLHDLVGRIYFGLDSERFYLKEEDLGEMYSESEYNYYELKNKIKQL